MAIKHIRLGIMSLALGLGCVAGIYTYMKREAHTYVQDTPRQLPNLGAPFRLTDQFGKIRTTQEFRGKYMLLYFGYSFCPDICPLGLQNISAALKKLGTDLDQVVPIFITIDPERDDVKSLNLYAQNWHSSFIMLTGSQKELNPVIKGFKVYAVKVKPEGTKADYVMDHSSLVYLLDRQGNFIDFFPHSTPPNIIAQKIQEHLTAEH